ncbi:MAG TPA: molybdopterin converting factor subunit 1 [Methylocystis sp.]|nr:molybdopterin converting factor subunit 1 [Methylocystis sp.]
MKALYFASIRERIGRGDEEIAPPATVRTIAELVQWLSERDEAYAVAFANRASVRAAIDRRHARPDSPIGSAREIAFFPPMTGG